MKSKTFCTTMTALSLVAAPAIAAAAPVSTAARAPVASAPVASARVSTPLTQPAGETVDGDNALAGGGFIVAALAVVAVGLGLYVAVDKNDDTPNSP